MKKIIIALAAVLLLLAGPVMSQKQLYFGLAGTAQNTWTTNQNNYGLPFEMDYAVTFGGSGNLNIGFDFNKHIGLKTEIGFSKLGQNYKDNYRDTAYSRNIRLNYLQIPLLFKFRSGGEVARFYVQVGPQFNILMSASQKYLQLGEVWNDEWTPQNWTRPIVIGENTITDRYNKLDIMGRLDFGVDIQIIENLCMNAGLTMAYGFTDINATDWQIKDHTGNYNPSHNIYVGFNVGINYVLPLGKE